MAIVDSLLNVLRSWRDARAADRSRIVTYLRKISESSLQFRDTLARVERGAESNVWVLQEKASLIGQYYKDLSSVLGGKISSELLDQLAGYLGRICIADNAPLVQLRGHLDGTARRAEKDPPYTIWIPPHSGRDAPIVDIDGPPTFEECLHELSTLAAQINALADAIEAGRDYR